MKKELAIRESNGLTVTLYWHSGTNRVSVTVDDAPRGELFELGARPDQALELFHHPYAHAGRRSATASTAVAA